MWKLERYGSYVWTVFDDDGMRCLCAAPMHTNGMIDPEEACDVSVSAFTEQELEEYVDYVGRIAQEPRVTVRGWIRG